MALTLSFACQPVRADRVADPWQSYLDAAAAAVAENDDGAAMLALEAALALALEEDPQGARSRLAHFEVAFPHYLLGQMEQVNRDIEAFKATRDLAPTEALFPFIATAKSFGDAYLARWSREPKTNVSASQLMISAAEFNYDIRIRLIRTLRPALSDTLAQALLDGAKADFDAKAFDKAIGALKESITLGDALQARRETLRTASRVLSPAATGSKSMPSDLENDIGGGVAFEARDYLVQTYVAQGWSLEFSSVKKAEEAFRQAVATEQELSAKYSNQLVGGQRDATLKNRVASAWRGLCRIAGRTYEKRDECAPRGAAAYQDALKLYVDREGDASLDVVDVARDFAKFLRETGDDRGASETEQRYRVTYVDETADYGIEPPADAKLAESQKGATPTRLPGGKVVTTRDLIAATRSNRLSDRPFALLHVAPTDKKTIFDASRFWAGDPPVASDSDAQARLKDLLTRLTNGDPHTPVVLFGEGIFDWAPYEAALQAQTLGFSSVYWYRGGMASWVDAGGSLFPRGSTP